MRFFAPIALLSCRAQLALRRPAEVLRASRRLLLLTLFYWAIIFLHLAFAVAQIELPPPDQSAPLIISAEHGNHWTEGAYQVWVLEGSCRIEQGQSRAAAKEAVLWIDRGGPYGNPPNKVIAYLEGDVNLEHAPATAIGNGAASGTANTSGTANARLQDKTWFGRFYSTSPPELRIVNQGGEPTVKPPVYDNAVARRSPQQLPGSQTATASKSSSQTAKTTQDKAVRKAQFQKVLPDPTAAQNLPTPSTGSSLSAGAAPPTSQGVLPPPGTPPAQILPAGAAPPGMRRIRIVPRSDVPVHAESFPDPTTNQTTVVITNGVNILIDGLPSAGGPMGVSGTIDVSADRVVLWTVTGQDVMGGSAVQSPNTPLELYMEGNIVLREQDRVVQAKAMYYNVQQNNGVILDAELLTPTPRFEGLVRLKAEVLRQVDRDHFVADHASLTTSRMGIPTYEFRSGTLTLTDEQIPVTNPFTGQPQVNPETGEPITEHEQMVTGQNNVLWVEGVPVFYWPFFAADLQRPPLYFDSIEYRHDDVFGSQALVDFNPYQILGIRKPPKGTNWVGSVDYLSLRGVGGGTKFSYDLPGFFNPAGHSEGFIDAWYIDDHGIDNLGLDRRDITFPNAGRGRTLGRFEEDLPDDWQLRLEVGEVTDRNFLEQYYQQEWEEQKDQVTRLGLRHTWDNMSLELSASALVDPFFTQTENLPRLDHYLMGQSLLDDHLTWYEHTNLGYLRQDKVEQPTDPTDYSQFRFLPYDVNAAGEQLATRQEIDYPFQVGPVKIVPYGLGELADWGDDIAGDRIQRAYGQAGVRTSMPMWSVDPTIKSQFWNVDGVAHKVVFEGDFSYTNASKNVDQLVLFDPIDDNNIQALRRRLAFEDYGNADPNSPLPGPANVFAVDPKFDERFYAVRRGIMDWVTGPTEIADDLTVFRLGVDQRWQTKRGIEGQEHVVDWIQLTTNFELFPSPEQNFGSNAGLLDYDFHWFVGDRLTLVSNGGYDFFSDGLRYTSVGGFISRPPRGSLYLGFNDYEGGPLASDVITGSYTYRMSPKWLSTFGTSFDLRNQGNIGESFRLTRVGESFLFTMGLNVDVSRGNVGFSVALIPRFLGHDPSVTRGQVDVPPAGLYGLE